MTSDQKAREAAVIACRNSHGSDAERINDAIDAYLSALTADLPDRVREIAERAALIDEHGWAAPIRKLTDPRAIVLANSIAMYDGVRFLLTALATANARHADNLCKDEGCPQYGLEHTCLILTKTERDLLKAQRARHAKMVRDQMFGDEPTFDAVLRQLAEQIEAEK